MGDTDSPNPNPNPNPNPTPPHPPVAGGGGALSSADRSKNSQPHRSPLQPHPPPARLEEEDGPVCSNCICFSAIAGMLNRRRIGFLCLILCTPFLLPLFFATCPLICAVEVCCFLCRKRRKGAKGQGRGRVEAGKGRGGLLQRYLEDQLLLVTMGSVDGVGGTVDEEEDEDDDGVDVEYFESARTFLQ
ncbi:uncharacterized protein LOC127246725 [Andrographis paniculata]|uniref:uncharacterized protein LOC127246725 n=1 Tax=Andrographis paniculata TaxID=175694 RepID=UPI0021E9806F|nr:uncharacterized protein LOC127246725 [Andrographis paniculata]